VSLACHRWLTRRYAQRRAAVATLWRALAVFRETYKAGRDVGLAESGFALPAYVCRRIPIGKQRDLFI